MQTFKEYVWSRPYKNDNERLVAVRVSDACMPDSGWAAIGINRIAREIGKSPRTVQRALKALDAAGILLRNVSAGIETQKGNTNLYIFNEWRIDAGYPASDEKTTLKDIVTIDEMIELAGGRILARINHPDLWGDKALTPHDKALTPQEGVRGDKALTPSTYSIYKKEKSSDTEPVIPVDETEAVEDAKPEPEQKPDTVEDQSQDSMSQRGEILQAVIARTGSIKPNMAQVVVEAIDEAGFDAVKWFTNNAQVNSINFEKYRHISSQPEIYRLARRLASVHNGTVSAPDVNRAIEVAGSLTLKGYKADDAERLGDKFLEWVGNRQFTSASLKLMVRADFLEYLERPAAQPTPVQTQAPPPVSGDSDYLPSVSETYDRKPYSEYTDEDHYRVNKTRAIGAVRMGIERSPHNATIKQLGAEKAQEIYDKALADARVEIEAEKQDTKGTENDKSSE